MQKRALILGAGQDGSFLAEHLLSKDYEVHILHRRSSVDNLWRIAKIRNGVHLHRGDLADPQSVENVVKDVFPNEIYNEADQDDINWSREIPAYSLDITAGAVGRLLETVRRHMTVNPLVRVFQPVSAVMFGQAQPPQSEETLIDPRSPFACAKAAAYHLCRHYRRDHGVFVSCGIMFNHDSPTRSEDYVLHKICKSAVRIAAGLQQDLKLGNLDTAFDIGFASDYMEAAWNVLQLAEPTDVCIGTGEAWTIRQMVREAFTKAGVEGDPLTRIGRELAFYRDTPPPTLQANISKAKKLFGFSPKVRLPALVKMIVDHAKEQLK